MPDAYLYHRFSTARQDYGSSLERQRGRTRELAQRKNWNIVEEIEDKGLSAWKGDHLKVGGLGRFYDRVRAGDIPPGSVLVIENLDRLSRMNVKFARRWIEDINEGGVAVAVCTPELFLDEEGMSGANMGTTILYLMEAGRSTGESSLKSERLLAAQEKRMEKARKGVVYSARMPAWLRGEKDGKFEVDEARAELIREIYRWCADGLGFEAIAKKLNDTVPPWPTQHAKNKPLWRPGYIRDILTKPYVEGEYHRRTGKDRAFTGEVINYYPRIVPAEVVSQARAALRDRRGATGPRHTEAKNLFAGLIKCGHCGESMTRVMSRNGDRTYAHLKCIRYHVAGAPVEGDTDAANSRRCVNATYYRYDAFEAAALKQILHLALDNTYFTRADETAPLVALVAQQAKELETAQARQRRLVAFVAEQDDADEAKDQLRELRPVIAALKDSLAKSQEALDRARGNVTPEEHLQRVIEVREAMGSEDRETREAARRRVQEAMRALVSVITCRRDYVEGKRTPDRQILVAMLGGALSIGFDNDGNLLGKHDATSVMSQHGSTNTGAEDEVEAVRARMARTKA